MNEDFKKYKSSFTRKRFGDKINKVFGTVGQKFIYSALLLWNAYKRSDTPSWAKNIVIGTLGYFLSPIDAIPDLSPLFGYTDDLGVLSFGLVSIACYINQEVRDKAEIQLKTFSVKLMVK